MCHPDIAYEHRDMDHRIVLAFLVVLGCTGLLIHLALWGVFRDMGASDYAGHQTTNPMMTSNEELREVGGDPAVTFPMPRLQPNPQADLNKFRLREEEQLNSYGWVDQEHGKIHIPIEQAIDVMASSWPKNAEPGAQPTKPATPPAQKQNDQPEAHE
jgi:hypothetical protein